MLTRRHFLELGVAAITAVPRGRVPPAPSTAFGVQLYTVRKQVVADPQAVLTELYKTGYRCVETFAAQYDRTAPELKRLIDDAGLALPSAHFTYEDFDRRFDYAKELGATDVVCGMAPASVTAESPDGFKRAAHQYNLWGEQAQKLGLRFAFHNHNSDHRSFGPLTGLDILMAETDPRLVQWQMDCYWVAEAGLNPLDLIRRYRARLQTLHFKDLKPGFPPSTTLDKEAQHFTEVGTGTLPWRAIWDGASVPYFFVEQDTTDIPPLESLRISCTNLKRLLA